MKAFATLLLAGILSPAAAGAQTLQQALELYYQNEINESLEIFEQLHAANPADPEVRVWLAENLAIFSEKERARELLDQALRNEPCNAQALVLLASLLNGRDPVQRDSAWAHRERAVECAPDDGNAWLDYWEAAFVRRDHEAEQRAQRRLAELRFISEPSMELGRWMLRSAPPNAVLFTRYHEDWVPISIAQTVEGLRPDVTVVSVNDLETPWYVRRVAAATGYPVPPAAQGLEDEELLPHDGVVGTLKDHAGVLWVREWTEGRNPRPLVVAATASTMFFGDAAHARWDGPLYTVHPAAAAPPDPPSFGEPRMDADAFEAHLPHLDMARLNGPHLHPSNRYVVDHLARHPAEYVAMMLRLYGNARVEQGRMDDARQALARMEALRAAGLLPPGYVQDVDRLRERIESGR